MSKEIIECQMKLSDLESAVRVITASLDGSPNHDLVAAGEKVSQLLDTEAEVSRSRTRVPTPRRLMRPSLLSGAPGAYGGRGSP